MPFQRFVLRLFFSDILSLRYPDTNRIWISVRYDGWDNFPRVMTLILWWPGNMMSCLAPPPSAGGPIIIDSFSARLSVHPWGNCKTYSISCSWWILFVSKVWSSPVDHVNAISKHVYGTPIFNRNIWSPMLNVSCSIIQTPLYGQCHEISLPYLKSFLHYFLSWISCSACPWEGYNLEICV